MLIIAACGPKGPSAVQKEGFAFIYDTLDVDVSSLSLPDMRLLFEEAIPLSDGYLCAFEQYAPGPYFSYPCRYLLRVNRETGQIHSVAFPYKNLPKWSIRERKGEVYMNYPEWCDTMWRFIPEQETWEDATAERDVVFEDEDYRVYSRDMHFSPDQTWFLDKRTGKEYVFPVAAGQVLRFGGYFYFTDLARFRGLVDPKVGVQCDSLSDYASTLSDSHPMMPLTLRSRFQEMKAFGEIYSFGEGDDGYNGCDYTWQRPDTVFIASFKAQKSLYQIVTDPETTWIAQVTGQGMAWIVDLGKRYDAWRVGQNQLCYMDDVANIGIIELGDTIRFHHLRY